MTTTVEKLEAAAGVAVVIKHFGNALDQLAALDEPDATAAHDAIAALQDAETAAHSLLDWITRDITEGT